MITAMRLGVLVAETSSAQLSMRAANRPSLPTALPQYTRQSARGRRYQPNRRLTSRAKRILVGAETPHWARL